jgi:hypothetical protein
VCSVVCSAVQTTHLAAAALASCLLPGCARTEPYAPPPQFFPAEAFRDDSRGDEWERSERIERSSHRETLIAAREPSLLGHGRAYRLVWQRSFEPTIIVRIERHGDAAILFARKLWSGRVVEERQVTFPWWWFGRAVDLERLWTAPGVVPQCEPAPPEAEIRTCWMSHDGSTWLFEAAHGDRYRVVVRQGKHLRDREHHDLRAIGFYMLLLAEMSLAGPVY